MDVSSNNEMCQNLMWNEIFSKLNIAEENETVDSFNYGYIDQKAKQMMTKMGFQNGTGLGLNNQGIVEPVEFQMNLGRRGFGHVIKGLQPAHFNFNYSQEGITVEEKVVWLLSNDDNNDLNCKQLSDWIVVGAKKLHVSDETKYCEENLLAEVLKAKGVFDQLDPYELCKARSRANPFETLRSAFFMNRAALKMANIDAATDFMFTTVDRQKEHRQSQCPYYFADICAGPGGFSEYVLWRKRWAFKGFGLTLRGEHDFKVHESSCAPSETFEPLYGIRDDGDVYFPENIRDFCENIKGSSQGLGVHFIMADGGFSVEGQENLQEVLSRQIYVCQCLIALKAIRPNGHFVVKLFDLFTPFSVGLIYLMYRCFQRVSILKPNSSRPANSERYLICCNLKTDRQISKIRDYMDLIVQTLFEMRSDPNQVHLDINEIVPEHLIQSDFKFVQYIIDSNNRLAQKQITGLNKLAMFCRDPALFEPRQDELRKQCLIYWRIPDKPKVALAHITTDDIIASAIHDTSFMYSFASELHSESDLDEILIDSDNWHYAFVASGKKTNLCNIYVGLGRNKVYRFQRNRWVKVKGVELIRGTIIYAELVKEFSCENQIRRSLHIIDALRLGDTSLADLSYQERLDLISIYCQAITRVSRTDLAYVRGKPVLPLPEMQFEHLPTNNGDWMHHLSENSCYAVHSLLLRKTDPSMSFGSTISTRVLLYLPNILDLQSNITTDRFTLWEKIISYSTITK